MDSFESNRVRNRQDSKREVYARTINQRETAMKWMPAEALRRNLEWEGRGKWGPRDSAVKIYKRVASGEKRAADERAFRAARDDKMDF